MHFKLMGLVLAALLLLACGDDSDSSGGSATPPATPPAAAPPAATPPATPAATPPTGASGAAAPAPVMCGAVMCTMGVTIAGTMLDPCCDSDSGDICGAGGMNMTTGELECEGLNQPGDLDPSCPDAMSILGTTLSGCCKPTGQCGVMSNVGYGCVERTDQNPTSLMGGAALEAVACGG